MTDTQETEARPLEGWVLFITNHFTHLVVEAQTASPRYHLARKLSERGQKLLVYSPIGRHVGSPIRDFLTSLRPKRVSNGNTVYLFPPVIVSPSSVTTPITLVMGTMFLLAYITLTRTKVVAQYSTTILVASVGAAVGRLKRIPQVANYGDPDFARESGLARRAFKFCENLVMTGRRTYAMVYVDEVVGDYIKENFHVGKTLFLPNGGYESGFSPPDIASPPVVELRRRLGLGGKLVILYTGQFTPVYRLDLLVTAAPEILSRFPNAVFVLVGSGPTHNSLQRSVRDGHLEDFFMMPGAVPYEALSDYLVLSDVCVQLLNDWCMGTKVLMYMVHRRPVVATGDWYDRYSLFLRNGRNILMVPPDPNSLKEALFDLLQSREERKRIGEAGWAAAQPYTWDRHAEDTLRLLDAAVKDRDSRKVRSRRGQRT